MKVSAKDILNPLIVAAQPSDTLTEAAGIMRYNDVGAVAVLDHGRLVGIATERDLVRAIDDGVDLSQSVVTDYMTPHPAGVTSETDVREVARAMLQLGVRHLPIVDDGDLVGMVGIRDVLLETVIEKSISA